MPLQSFLERRNAADVLMAFRATMGLDSTYDSAPTWPFRMGPLTLAVPNFSWRRAAIQQHDLHHLLTGYPFDMRGECQVATWEFAAGPYAHAGATALILPLVLLGCLWSPRAIWRAYRKGRRARSLYTPELRNIALDLSFEELVARTQDRHRPSSRMSDAFGFSGLLAKSAALWLTPIAACLIGLLYLF